MVTSGYSTQPALLPTVIILMFVMLLMAESGIIRFIVRADAQTVAGTTDSTNNIVPSLSELADSFKGNLSST